VADSNVEAEWRALLEAGLDGYSLRIGTNATA
jgi:hypothetical protein